MCPIGFALWLTLNPTWWTADDLSALQQSAPLPTNRQAASIPVAGPGRIIIHKPAPLPASLQAALTSSPEECPCEIPSWKRFGQEMMQGQHGASARPAQNRLDRDYSLSRSPLFWNPNADDPDETRWKPLHLGWYGRTSFSLVGRVPWRPGTLPYVEHAEYVLIEWGPRPVWLRLEDHARPIPGGGLFSSDVHDVDPGITCHRAIAQRTNGPRRRYLSVWVDAAK